MEKPYPLPSRRPSDGIWDKLRQVAKPDSRLHFDFAHMHPDFEGSEAAVTRVFDAVGAQPLTLAFTAPDGALTGLREALLRRGCRVVLSTFCMRRGFRLLDPARIAPADYAFAATLDGLDRFGIPQTIADLARLGPMDLLMTGAAAIAANGVRFGRSYQFFDIEWGLLAEIGVAREHTPVGALVHDVQVTADRLDPLPCEAVPDFIATPARLITVARRARRPAGVAWRELDPDDIEQMPALIELQRARGLRP